MGRIGRKITGDEKSFRLRFPPEQEELFEKETSAERSRELYVRGYAALLIYLFFLISDRYMIPDIFQLAIFIRVGIFTPLIIAAMLIQKFSPPPSIRESLESVAVFLIALSLVFLISYSGSELSVIYHPGVSLAIIFANLIVKLRFHHAVAVSSLIFVLYIACIPFYTGNSPAIQTFNVVFMLSSIMISLVANYSLEKETRKNFLLIHREKQKNLSLNEENTELQTLSGMDGLTGIANRRAMDTYIINLLRNDSGSERGVILVDIDFFKDYNDTYGHQAGDECLKKVAGALHSVVREQADLTARYGGEEFILLLSRTDREKLMKIADRILEIVADLAIPHEASRVSDRLTVSCGLALGSPDSPAAMEALIGMADKGLYRAKREGRNRAVFQSA